MDAGVLELLVESHGSLAGGSAEGGASVLKAAQVVALAIAGSAPERAAPSVADRLARSAQEALAAASPQSAAALLQLLGDAVSLPAVAAAVGRCGLAEDLIALYVDYSEQMYEGAAVPGAKRGKVSSLLTARNTRPALMFLLPPWTRTSHIWQLALSPLPLSPRPHCLLACGRPLRRFPQPLQHHRRWQPRGRAAGQLEQCHMDC